MVFLVLLVSIVQHLQELQHDTSFPLPATLIMLELKPEIGQPDVMEYLQREK